MSTARVTLLLLLMASVARAQTGPAQPGFEADADRDGLADGWTLQRTFAPVKAVLDPTVKHEGGAAQRLDLAARGGGAVSQTLSAPAGPCSFTCWVRTSLAPVDGVCLYLQWLGTAGELVGLGRPSVTLAGNCQWTRLVCSGTPPADATQVRLRIVAGNGEGTGGSVWLDDAALRPGLDVGAVLQNASFETDADGDGHPDGWRPFMAGGGFELTRDATVARSGQASARLTGLTNHGDRASYGQVAYTCEAVPGVRLRFWYKGMGACTGFVRYRPAPGVTLPGGKEFYDTLSFSAPLPQTDWNECVFDAVAPDAARTAGKVSIEVNLYQRGEGTLWLDDVSLEPLN